MTAGLVLAAGAATRFGSAQSLPVPRGRPMLEHVLDAARAAGLEPVIVVLGTAASEIDASIAWRSERRVFNPEPERGLATSLRIGLSAVEADGPEADAM